jgi:YD repeat-containing protein
MDAGIYPADPERDGKYQKNGHAQDNLGRIVRSENVSQQPPKAMSTTTYHYDDRHRLVRKTVNGGMMAMLAVNYRYAEGI